MPTQLDRRNLLTSLALSPLTLTGLGAFTGAAEAQAAEAGLIAANVCMVTPEVTEGPFYLDPGLVRADITEGLPGVPLVLKLQVVTADCQPIEGARVDVWHCSADGDYSGFDNQGSDAARDTASETFLRGTQMTDALGVAQFRTIYPGWYRGRTTHVHYKVFLDTRTVLTSQLFFPDALSEYLFRNVAPYNARSVSRDTLNSGDGIAAGAGEGAYAAVRETPDAYVAALVVGIDPSVEPAAGLGLRGPRGPGGGFGGGASGGGGMVPGG